MNYRNFGNTGLSVSETGFGAWAIGGSAMIGDTAIGWGEADDAVSKKAIHSALDAGINFFDTADIYGLGHSESILGECIGNREDVFIASKAGNVSRNETFTVDYSKKHILSACDASLKRLKRDRIDFYQLHTARLAHLMDGECIEAMEDLQKQGKIRFWGLSLNTFHPLPEAEFLVERNLGRGFQLVFNMLNQRALPVMHKAASKGYGIIARMPLQFGLLTGKFNKDTRFPSSDHRAKRLTPELIETSNSTLSPVWELCEKYGCSQTRLALAFVLSYPEISTVIPGIRTPEQVLDNTAGLISLNEPDRKYIEELGKGDFIPLMERIEKAG